VLVRIRKTRSQLSGIELNNTLAGSLTIQQAGSPHSESYGQEEV
jgi:hypothetical protein